MHVVLYEELCRHPERVFRKLARKIRVPMNAAVLRQLHSQSFMAGSDAAVPAYDPVTAWRTTLSAADVREIREVVARFGLERYVVDD
jgi:hypothetical protein